MTEGVRRDEWERTSHVLAWLENVNKTRESRPTNPASRNPYLIEEIQANAPKLDDPAILAAMCGVLPAD